MHALHGSRWPWLAALGAAVLAAAPAASAQTRGNTVTVPYAVTFQTEDQQNWRPGSTSTDPFEFPVFDFSWSGSGGTEDGVATFFGSKFGGNFTGSVSISSEMRIVFPHLGRGGVDISYPVAIEVILPEPNSFRGGETVSIRTAWSLQDDWEFRTHPTPTTMDFRGSGSFGGSASGELCFFACTGEFTFVPSFHESDDDFRFFFLSNDPLIESQIPLVVGNAGLPHKFGIAETFLHGVSGTIAMPVVTDFDVSVASNGRDLLAGGVNKYGDLKFDLDHWLRYVGLPPLGIRIDVDSAAGIVYDFQTADLDVNLDLALRQSFSFRPTLMATIAFADPVRWSVTDSTGTVVQTGVGTEVTFEVGQTIDVVFPDGRTAPLGTVPEFSLDNVFWTSTVHDNWGDVHGTVGYFELKLPEQNWLQTVREKIGEEWEFDCDPEVWTETVCTVAKAIVSAAERVNSVFWELVDKFGWVDKDRKSDAVNVKLGPLTDGALATFSKTDYIHPTDPNRPIGFPLGGFDTFTEAVFELDPENPIIAVTSQFASGLASGTGPAGTITQTTVVENVGDVRLDMTQVLDALSFDAAGYTIELHAGDGLTANPAFDGAADTQAVDGNGTLPVGGSATITTRLGVAPGGRYLSSVNVQGTSPIGTDVNDAAQARFAVFGLNIVPATLQAKSNGQLPVVIFGSPQLDVADIDPRTLTLEGVPATRVDYEDANDDGLGDLTVKFDRPAVVEALEARLKAPAVAAGAESPAADAALVASAVLSDTRLSESARGDQNGNGRLDVGDLRALLIADNGTDAPRAPAAGSPNRQALTLVLLGTLTDGTPFMGEDQLTLKQ